MSAPSPRALTVAILTLQDLQSMHLPVDLSGYDPQTLSQMVRDATGWVNGEARHANGFEAHRVIDRVYGTGTNKLMSTYYPVNVLNGITLIFPSNQGNVNLPGANQVPIDPSRVVIDHEAGLLYNWSPFVFQTIGYMTVFPEDVPIDIDYYTGYVSQVTTTVVPAGSNYVPVDNASCFYFNQSIRLYEANVPEYLIVMGTTQQGSVQAVVTQAPLLYSHPAGVNIGNMPPEVRLAAAYVVCDFALRELNPENLYRLKIGDVEKQYQRELPVRGKVTSNITGPTLETERPFIKEARRLLEHYYTDRGVR